YFDEVEKSGNKTHALEHMLDQLLLPCWITSFTTMVGFASLMVSDVGPIRDFGLFATIGVLLAFVFSILLVCPIIQLFGVHRKKIDSLDEKGIGGGLKTLFRMSLYPVPVNIIAFIVLVLSVFGIYQMKVETNFLEFFKENSPTRQANSFVEKYFAGIAPLEITFAPKEGDMTQYKALKRLDSFEQMLLKDPFLKKYVDGATSIVDFYKFANMVKMPSLENLLRPKNLKISGALFDPREYKLPETERDYTINAQLFRKITEVYSGAKMGVRKFLAKSMDESTSPSSNSGEWKYARISVRLKASSSTITANVVNYIRNLGKKKFPQDEIHVTGTASLFAEAANSIVESQKASFVLAIVIIFFTMIIVFRSLIVGFLGLIPNIIPIGTTFGAMGWFGIPLNSSTSMVASISIGIAVDVAVHFISRFRLEFQGPGTTRKAIYATYKKSGKPILFTSSILMAGFMVLSLASFVPTIQFGILTCITIFSALIAGLVVLPSVILWIYGGRKMDKNENSERKDPS
ncbi:MAG: hypothetical protein D6785_00095, partial [Planctomycetota bacterium]